MQIRPNHEDPVLVCQLESKCRFEARSYVLFLSEPRRSRLVASSRREPQHRSSNAGVTYETERLDGVEMIDMNLAIRWTGHNRAQKDYDQTTR